MASALGVAALMWLGVPNPERLANISYEVPPRCPAVAVFLDLLERDLGRRIRLAPRQDPHVLVYIRTIPTREYELTLVTTDGVISGGHRDRGCATLVRIAALQVSVLLAREPPEPPAVAWHAPAANVAARTDAPPTPCPGSVRPPSPADRSRPRATASSGATVRVLAGGEFGGAGRHAVVGAAFAYRWRIVHAQARAMYMLPTTYRLTDDGSVGARIQVGAAAVAVGMHLPLGRAELHGELGLEAGASVSRGVGVPAPRTVRQPWVAPLVTLAIRRRLGGPVALIGGLEVGPLLHRAALRAPGAAYAYRAGAITSRVWLGLEFTMARDNSGGRPEKVAR